MKGITLERESEKLAGVTDRVQILNVDGRILGYFTPHDDRAAYVRVEVPELGDERRLQAEEDIKAGRVYTTAQVFEQLHSLEIR